MIDHANELRRHARKIPHPQGETPGVMLRAADEIDRLQNVIASPYSMTRDDVIRMAMEAGFYDGKEDLFWAGSEDLERFAALVAAAEREEFLKWCEVNIEGITPKTDWAKGYVMALKNVADGFRARGSQ